jgi:hypothetical protein
MNQHTDKINADDFMIVRANIIDCNDECNKDDDIDPRERVYVSVDAWLGGDLCTVGFHTHEARDYTLDTNLRCVAFDYSELDKLTADACDKYGKINNVEDCDNIAYAMRKRIEEIIKQKSGAQKRYDDYITANYVENESGQWVKK